MNRDQKAAAIAEIASNIDESQAIFAVDYRGITVAQVAELRAKLRDAGATFTVVKNSLTERAADQVQTPVLKEFLAGPTALTFVRGDAAVAAKAIADYARATQLLPFKGGLMDGSPLDADQIRSLSRLPSREVLYGQLVGIVASPVSGLVRTMAALLGGLAVALGQVREKKESGEIPAGEPPAAAAPAAEAQEAPAADAEAPGVEAGTSEAEAPEAEAPEAEAPTEEETPTEAEAPAEEGHAAEAEAPAEEGPAAEAEEQAEQAGEEPAEPDGNQADVSAETQPEAPAEEPEDAEMNTTKED